MLRCKKHVGLVVWGSGVGKWILFYAKSHTHTQSSRHFNSLRKDVNVKARPVIVFHVFAWGTLRTCLEMVGKTQNLSIESEWTNQIWSLPAGSMQLVCQVFFFILGDFWLSRNVYRRRRRRWRWKWRSDWLAQFPFNIENGCRIWVNSKHPEPRA